MTVQMETQGQGTGDLLRPIRLNAAAWGVVKDSGGGGGGSTVYWPSEQGNAKQGLKQDEGPEYRQ